jgi:hypothetical protein
LDCLAAHHLPVGISFSPHSQLGDVLHQPVLVDVPSGQPVVAPLQSHTVVPDDAYHIYLTVLVSLAQWQFYLGRDLVKDNPLLWQPPQEHPTPERVLQDRGSQGFSERLAPCRAKIDNPSANARKVTRMASRAASHST